MHNQNAVLLLALATSTAAATLIFAAPQATSGTPATGPTATTPATNPTTGPATAPPRGRGRAGGGAGAAGGAGRGRGPQGPEPGVHDPVMIKAGDFYYLYRTSGYINAMRSKDFQSWEPLPPVFSEKPAWSNAIQPNRTDFWAPDISFHDGKYYLYTCASVFGRNTSTIGLATNKTLDPASPDYKWEDQGEILSSKAADFYNAIDPNAFWDKDGTGWLTFGSFYWNQSNPKSATEGGMMLVELDPKTGKMKASAQLKSVASRAAPARAIEAPFIVRNGDWYYLFVSWDVCCQGLRSTYRIMVGRSNKVTGPYVDKDGKDMVQGGGTQILAGDGDRIIGPGHQAIVEDVTHVEDGTPGTPNHRWLLLYHFYDGYTPNGTSKLQIRTMTFDDKAWPVIGEVLNKPATPPIRPEIRTP